jgi:hypothetical protein
VNQITQITARCPYLDGGALVAVAGDRCSKPDIGDLIHSDTSLSDGDVNNIDNKLKADWGIQ